MAYRLNAAITFGKLCFVAIACLICTAAGQAMEISSCWVTEPPIVDGRATDWDSIPTTYLGDEGVVLGLCNDSTNVYVLFRFRDPGWLRAIRMTGLTLWLDAEGKEKEEFGIRYYGGPSLAELMELAEPGDNNLLSGLPPERRERMEERMERRKEELIVIYRGREQPDAILTDGSAGPLVDFGSSRTLFTYEFAVPLQGSDYATFGMAAEPGSIISVGFAWGGMRRGDIGKMGDAVPGGFAGGERGGPPRGGGRMGGAGPDRGRMEPPEEHEFWVRTPLANPQGGGSVE